MALAFCLFNSVGHDGRNKKATVGVLTRNTLQKSCSKPQLACRSAAVPCFQQPPPRQANRSLGLPKTRFYTGQRFDECVCLRFLFDWNANRVHAPSAPRQLAELGMALQWRCSDRDSNNGGREQSFVPTLRCCSLQHDFVCKLTLWLF
jgi:hypothetical protein